MYNDLFSILIIKKINHHIKKLMDISYNYTFTNNAITPRYHPEEYYGATSL